MKEGVVNVQAFSEVPYLPPPSNHLLIPKTITMVFAYTIPFLKMIYPPLCAWKFQNRTLLMGWVLDARYYLMLTDYFSERIPMTNVDWVRCFCCVDILFTSPGGLKLRTWSEHFLPLCYQDVVSVIYLWYSLRAWRTAVNRRWYLL